MATIRQFEDLEAWKKARLLAQEIYQLSKVGGFAKDFDLSSQIRRSAGSVMDNIAEGFERGGRGEFMQFLGIAKGSAGEVKSQLYRALDQQYVTTEQFDHLYALLSEIARLIKGLLNYLHNTEHKGERFKKPALDAQVNGSSTN